MAPQTRVLLVEHLDATGAAAIDARHHAAALRAAEFEVEGLVLDGDRGTDLLFPAGDRRTGAGFHFVERGQYSEITARVRASRADIVLWAGAAPGGGEAARAIPAGRQAYWWPTGHAGANAVAGPLPVLEPALAPVDGSVLSDDASGRRWLSLWDGPFALVPSVPGARAAAEIVEVYARTADAFDEADLVVLAHADPDFERLARGAGIGQRVHFVGPAPREAEHAWLGTASVALVCGDAPLSGGMVLRALGLGCPLLGVGEAAAPLARWLADHHLGWGGPEAALDVRLGTALCGEASVTEVRERGRMVAVAHDEQALGARLAAALGGAAGERKAA